MAQRVNVVLVDDLDGQEAAETVNFALDGVSYEIDLSSANAEELRAALRKWIEAGRRVGGRRAMSRKRTNGGTSSDDLREWARQNGYEVKSRGRVSAEIREAYEAAHR